MSYASLTRRDPNPLKRWVQRRRIEDAIDLILNGKEPACIVDYGGGDGFAAAWLARKSPQARILCFEPDPVLAAEAEAALADAPNGAVATVESQLQDGAADAILCAEVFEHLPEAETAVAVDTLWRVLKPGGRLVVGVPVEIGPPALAKGLFRALRRPGAFDARWRHVLAAAAGRPPSDRPAGRIGERLYYGHHLGFDHRRLRATLSARFTPEAERASPFAFLPVWLSSELYLVYRKAI